MRHSDVPWQMADVGNVNALITRNGLGDGKRLVGLKSLCLSKQGVSIERERGSRLIL